MLFSQSSQRVQTGPPVLSMPGKMQRYCLMLISKKLGNFCTSASESSRFSRGPIVQRRGFPKRRRGQGWWGDLCIIPEAHSGPIARTSTASKIADKIPESYILAFSQASAHIWILRPLAVPPSQRDSNGVDSEYEVHCTVIEVLVRSGGTTKSILWSTRSCG